MTTTGAVATRERILRAAAELLSEGGRDAVSTRAVSAAAGVQAPTLYRLFGDKDGLLDAVAAYCFERYLADKQLMGHTDDPVGDLRRGWDLHIEFGLSHPAFYVLMCGGQGAAAESSAGQEAAAILRRLLERVAEAGRLAMSVERAARLVSAAGTGVVLELIGTPPDERDPELSTLARETVLRTITAGPAGAVASTTGPAAQATTLRETLRRHGTEVLSDAEFALLGEWLDRIADRG